MTITTEQIQTFFKNRLYKQVDRHLLKRLSDDGFFQNDAITKEGKTSLYPKKTLNHLLAYVLTSECLFNLGLISRVKKKNVCFAAAKSVANFFNRSIANTIEPTSVMSAFIQTVTTIDPRLTKEGLFFIIRENRHFLFIEGTTPPTDSGVEEQNINIMFPKICVAYFFILSVLNGTFEVCFYENYKAFIEYMTKTETSAFGESLADFVVANPTFSNIANKNSLATLTSLTPDSNIDDRIDDLLNLQNVLLLIKSISEPMQKNNVLALLNFIHIFDNQASWLTADILLPTLTKINPAFASHNAKTLRLAAEFLTIANAI